MTARKPNILWIVTTQWRAQACGYAGDSDARTPTLDALAAQSVNYAQAVTPHPFGPFARAAMFTGVRSPENGVRDYFDPLPRDSRTIAHEMAGAGYRTAFFGKWHLAPRDPAAPLVGEAHARTVVAESSRGGFGFWEGFESGFLLNDPWLHGTRFPEPARIEGYQSDVLVDRSLSWLGARTEDALPWFAVVSLEAPHPPYGAAAAGIRPREAVSLALRGNVPTGGKVEARARRELAGYHAHLEATDRAIGRLIGHLKTEESIVVFTSVHGDMHGAHGLFRKGWPHEESVRVPLLVRHPREVPRRVESAVSLLDLPAMTKAWSRGKMWEGLPEHAGISMPSVVALPDQGDRAWRGVRTTERKWVCSADGQPWLFFDLVEDPLECRNLIGEPDRWRDLAALAERP